MSIQSVHIQSNGQTADGKSTVNTAEVTSNRELRTIGSLTDASGTPIGAFTTDGYLALAVASPGHISTGNSTSTPLAGGATFTGSAEDITNFGVISVVVKASHASATDGLKVQYSSDGTNWDQQDEFTISANTGKIFTFQCACRYFRVVYTNGATLQTYFRLQTVLKPFYVKPSSHRILDGIVGQDDAELVKAILTAQKPDTTFTNIDCTAGGNLKVSVEEFDPSAIQPSPTTFANGKTTTNAGSAIVIKANTTIKAVTVKALTTNTGIVYIGNSSVSSANGFELQAGESVSIDIDNTNKVYFDVSVNGEGVTYAYVA